MDYAVSALFFAVKVFVVWLAAAVLIAVVVRLLRRRQPARGQLEVRQLNSRFDRLGDALSFAVHRPSRQELRRLAKSRRVAKGAEKPSVYVLDFTGDLLAHAVESLREEVTAIIAAAREHDEVVLRLESPGGAVPHYGFAAAQLTRLKEKKIKVTVCIDRIAASGGYMMACVADTIVAAPFSIIGSIGVVAELPNLHRLLKKNDIDFEQITAGEYKRTVSVFGEITEPGRQKFQQQLEETHVLFKEFVKANRPNLAIDEVATGEHWLGRRALELGLVDQLGTSDDFLLSKAKDRALFEVSYTPARSWRDRMGMLAASTVDRVLLTVLSRLKGFEVS